MEYCRRHLKKDELAAWFDQVVKEMADQGWELGRRTPTYGYVRTFWEQQGRGPFQGSYLLFRRPDKYLQYNSIETNNNS